jgi:hypothetical protein
MYAEHVPASASGESAWDPQCRADWARHPRIWVNYGMSSSEKPEPERYVRSESEAAQLDRNFAELLQELRVSQTGVQILFAFLLSIAFQQRFKELTDHQLGLYLATLISAALAAVFLIAPVSVHRIVFRLRLKVELVRWTSRLAITGLVFLLLAIVGAVALIVDFVSTPLAAGLLAALVALMCLMFWYALPLRWRLVRRREDLAEKEAKRREAGPEDPGGNRPG